MPRSRGVKTYLPILLGFLIIVIIISTGWFKPILGWLRTGLLYPLTRLGRVSWPIGYQNIPDLSNALALCQAKAANEIIKETELQHLQKENAELRNQLHFKPKISITTVGAEIISREIGNLHQVVIVNRGTKDNVAVNQPVITGQGILVGKVIKVDTAVAWVRLLSDGQSAVGATVVNDSGSVGIVEGGYGLSLQMRFIPRDEIITVGERVVTSGLEPNLPSGLVIGTIAMVQNEAYQLFQTAILTPLGEFSKLRLLNIITAF